MLCLAVLAYLGVEELAVDPDLSKVGYEGRHAIGGLLPTCHTSELTKEPRSHRSEIRRVVHSLFIWQACRRPCVSGLHFTSRSIGRTLWYSSNVGSTGLRNGSASGLCRSASTRARHCTQASVVQVESSVGVCERGPRGRARHRARSVSYQPQGVQRRALIG